MDTINNNMNNSMLNTDNKLSSAPSPSPSPFMQAGGPPPSSIPAPPISYRNLKDMHKTTINGKRLRLRNWGRVSEEGFSGFDRAFYYRSRLPFEKNVVLEELRSKHQPLNTQPAPTSSGSRSIPSDLSGTVSPLAGAPYAGLSTGGAPMMTGQTMAGQMMTGQMMTGQTMTGQMMTTGPIMTGQTTTGPMMMAPMMTAPILSAPILSTPPFISAPNHMLATTVPVPMLNPPINDGRRYEKLYKKNAGNISKNVKRRGTRRDHLVQPSQSSMMMQSPSYIQPQSYATQPIATTSFIQQPMMPMTTTGVMPMTTGAMPLAGTMPLPVTNKHGMHRRAQQATKGHPQPVYTNIVQTGVPMM